VVRKTNLYDFHTLKLNFLSKTNLNVKATGYYGYYQVGDNIYRNNNLVAQCPVCDMANNMAKDLDEYNLL